MSIGREEAEKIIKDFNSIAPIKGKPVSNSKNTQEKTEVKSGKGEHKDDEEKKSNKDGKKASNMKLIVIITVIIVILIIGIYVYMYPGPKGKLLKKTQTPPANNPPPAQTASQ